MQSASMMLCQWSGVVVSEYCGCVSGAVWLCQSGVVVSVVRSGVRTVVVSEQWLCQWCSVVVSE